MKKLPIFALVVSMCVVLQGGLYGDIIDVTNLSDSGSGSLRAALLAAAAYDEIIFTDSLDGTISLGSSLPSIGVQLDIVGPTSGTVVIDGGDTYSAFQVEDGGVVTISDLHLANMQISDSGAGLLVGDEGEVSLVNCSFTNCVAVNGSGGAIACGAEVLVHADTVTFSNNSAGTSGDDIDLGSDSGLAYECSATITDPIAVSGGGAIYKYGEGQVTFNFPDSAAIGIVVYQGTLLTSGTRTMETIALDTLRGSHSSLYLVNQGTVKPSLSIGTTTTTDDYVQTGDGTLEIAISPTANDALSVGGYAYLDGTLSILPEAGSYEIGTRYTILQSTSEISGAFASVTSSDMEFTVDYDYPNHTVEIEIDSL